MTFACPVLTGQNFESTAIANTFHRCDVKQTDFSNADCYAVTLKFIIEHTLCVFGM